MGGMTVPFRGFAEQALQVGAASGRNGALRETQALPSGAVRSGAGHDVAGYQERAPVVRTGFLLRVRHNQNRLGVEGGDFCNIDAPATTLKACGCFASCTGKERSEPSGAPEAAADRSEKAMASAFLFSSQHTSCKISDSMSILGPKRLGAAYREARTTRSVCNVPPSPGLFWRPCC